MKKIKIFILCLFFVALGTVGAVAGFYVNENSTAVVNWLNNTINVTNDDYKQLVEESKLTTMQLNLKIARLEEENSQLEIEKEQLNTRIAELEQGNEEDKSLIEEYKLQLADLEAQIAEKDLMIAELQELVNSVYQELVEEILVLPDDLKDKNLTYRVFGNDFLITVDGSMRVYEFNYDEGSLNLISSNSRYANASSIFKQVPNGYFYPGSYSSGGYSYACVTYYDKNTKESKELVQKSGDTVMYFDYDNGCFIFSSVGVHYFDYATSSATQYYTGSLNLVSNNVYEDENSFVFNLCTKNSLSRINSIYFNKQNKTCFNVNLDLGTSYGTSSYSKYFRLKGSLYCLVGKFYSTGTFGLYRINETDSTTELVYTFDDQTAGIIGDTFVNENLAVFSYAKNIYQFDGETVTIFKDSASNVVSQNGSNCELIAETETAEYYSNTETSYIFKYTKSTSEVEIIDIGYMFVAGAMVNDNTLILVRKSGVSYLDLTTDTISDLRSGTFNLIYVIGDNFYLIYSYSIQMTIYAYSCSTLELVGSATNYVITGYMDYGSAVVFYSDKQYTIFNPNSSSYGVNVACSYDSSLSSLEERTFYLKSSDLTDGALYTKLVYNEDFTECTRSLVLVK